MRQGRKILFLLFLSLGISVISCLKSDKPGIPEDILEVLHRSGIFKPGLMTIILQYQTPEDSLKLEATYFILRNLENNYTIHHSLVDSSDNNILIDIESFPDLRSIISYRDSLENEIGELHYRPDTIYLDFKHLDPDFLIDHINSSFNTWNNSFGIQSYDFYTFLEYILPYRVTNEPIELYQDHFNKKYGNIKDSLGDPLELALAINKLVNKEISYDERLSIMPNPQSIIQLENNKRGNLLDINQYKVKALRSLGIAAALDYTPFFADSISGYYITRVFLPDGSTVNLSHTGIDTVMSSNKRIAKVYRRSFGIVDNCLFKIKEVNTHTPPFLGNYCYIDVSAEYLDVVDTVIRLDDCSNYAYLAITNENELKAIAWGECDSTGIVRFTDMGRNQSYTPVIVEKKEIKPIAGSFMVK